MNWVARFALVAALLGGCATLPGSTEPDPRTLPGDDAAGGDGTQLGGSGTSSGPGLPIEEVINATLDEPLLVNGFLVASDDEVRLCSALAESHPPQCGGAALTVEGLDLASVEEPLSTASGVTWSDQPIQLLGRVTRDVLTVEQQSEGDVEY